jgi:hypothetical protein
VRHYSASNETDPRAGKPARSMVLGIDQLERDVRAFNDGTSTAGWSPQFVADSVNRICQTDVGVQVVMP